MTSIIDSREKIKELDKSNLLGSVEALPDQILDALTQVSSVVIPDSYKSIKNVVVSGMGGSVLGSYVIKHLFKSELKVPFEIVSHYALPEYVNSDTLVLLSSYSGTTEETLASAQDARTRGAKVMVITGGGPLERLAIQYNWPLYKIVATYNPCGQPRLAIGYTIVGQLGLFAKLGIISDQSDLLAKTVIGLKQMIPTLTPEIENNPAKLLAFAAFDKHLIFVAAEHLIGAAHIMNNQVNENAKSLTSEWHLPEFNHHYMEAISFPKLAKDTTLFILFNSSLYHERVQKRVLITKQLLEDKGYEVQLVQASAPTMLEQVFEIVQLGEFVTSYLPILYGINPSGIPNVDWFKSEMAK
ncbi:MAG: SIS domain-containing protein [bacterium]